MTDLIYTPPFAGGKPRELTGRLASKIAPEDFGAIGDGTADDAPALQAAATASRVSKTPMVGRGTYLIGSALDFTEAVVDFSAATIKLADNFAPPVAITLGQPSETAQTTKGRYSADLFIDGNRTNQSGTPIAVLIEDLITPSNRFVIRGTDCNTLCKIQGATEYISVDIHADRCELACHLAEKTTNPLGDATPDDILVNIYGHGCDGYFKAENTDHVTAKVNLYVEQGGGTAGDRGVELLGAMGEFTLGGIIRGFQGDVAVYADMSDGRSQVMFDHLLIDSGGGIHAVHVLNAGVVSGFLSTRAARRVLLENVTRGINLSVVTNQAQHGPVVRLGSGTGSVRCGILNLVCADTAPNSRPLQVQNAMALNVNCQTDGIGTPVLLNSPGGVNMTQVNCPVDWAREVTFDALKKDTSGMTASVEVDDDSFIAFTPPHSAGRVMVREENRPGYLTGMFHTAALAMTEIKSSVIYDAGTGPLKGTSGVDGSVTVASGGDGKLYIENRRGAPIRFWLVLD